MGNKKGHRAGGKFKGHTTVIDAALPVADALAKMNEVTSISINIITPTRSVAHAMVVSHKETTSGLEVKVRGNKFVQVFYVYLHAADRPAVIEKLERNFPRPQARKHKKGKKRRRQPSDRPQARTWIHKA